MINVKPRPHDFNTRTIDARGWTWWYPDDRHDYVHPSWPWGGVTQCFATEWPVGISLGQVIRDWPRCSLRTGDRIIVAIPGVQEFLRLDYQGHTAGGGV